MKRIAAPCLLLGTAVLLSLVRQGFDFGVGNNALTMPILQLASDPQLYPGDPYTATLGNYFSVLWRVLAWFTGVEDWSTVFFWLHAATRLLMAVALYLLLNQLVNDWRRAALGASLLLFGPTLFDISPVGRSDLLLQYFTHTELALALAMLAFALALNGRWVASAICTGLAFDMNAFLGAWAVTALGGVALWKIPGDDVRRIISRLVGFTSGFAVVALPTLIWIGSAIGTHGSGPMSFDYREYLLEYYPYHFLITSAEATSVVELGFVAISGIFGLRLLRPFPQAFALLYLGIIVLFDIGMVLPFVTSSPALLNLHLLRADSLMVFLSAVAIIAGSMQRMVTDGRLDRASVLALIPVAGVLTGNWLIAAVGAAVLRASGDREARAADRWIELTLIGAVAVAVAVVGLPGQGRIATASLLGASALLAVLFEARFAVVVGLLALSKFTGAAWLAVAGLLLALVWILPDRARKYETPSLYVAALLVVAQAATADNIYGRVGAAVIGVLVLVTLWRPRIKEIRLGYAVVLVLLVLVVPAAARDFKDRLAKRSLSNLDERALAWQDVQRWARRETAVGATFMVIPLYQQGFGVFAQRAIWVDWKQGGAVAWDQSYYTIWKERITRQRQLRDPRDLLTYAHEQGVRYVIANSENSWERFSSARCYDNRHFSVYDGEAIDLEAIDRKLK